MHDVVAMEDCPRRLLDIVTRNNGSVPRSMSVYSPTGFHGQSLVRCIAGSRRLSGSDMPWLTEERCDARAEIR